MQQRSVMVMHHAPTDLCIHVPFRECLSGIDYNKSTLSNNTCTYTFLYVYAGLLHIIKRYVFYLFCLYAGNACCPCTLWKGVLYKHNDYM